MAGIRAFLIVLLFMSLIIVNPAAASVVKTSSGPVRGSDGAAAVQGNSIRGAAGRCAALGTAVLAETLDKAA